MFGSSKIILVDILNYKGIILPPIEVMSLVGITFFYALLVKFSAFSFFSSSNFIFVNNMDVVIISYNTNIFNHTWDRRSRCSVRNSEAIIDQCSIFQFYVLLIRCFKELDWGSSELNEMQLTGIAALVKCNNLSIFQSFSLL